MEPVHSGTKTNTVLYMPVGPDCPVNRMYSERMRFLFKNGFGPPDFNSKPENERYFVGRATEDDLTEEAKIMFGIK